MDNEENVSYEEGDENLDDVYYGEEEPEDLEDLEVMKRRVQEMEDEHDKLNKIQQQVEKQIKSAADSIDENSVYVYLLLFDFVFKFS